MIECPHNIDNIEFILSDAVKYFLPKGNYFYYGGSICNHCKKTIKTYLEEVEYKKDYVKHLQAKIDKENLKVGVIMKEQKFKLWCKNKNEWEEDDWYILPSGTVAELKSGRIMNPENHILIRFTGLYDNKSKEIWESDEVKLTGDDYFSNNHISINRTEGESWEFIGVVKMEFGCWLVEDKDKLCITFLEIESEDLGIEVINNIYEPVR